MRINRRIGFGAVAIALALVVAACSDDDATTTTTMAEALDIVETAQAVGDFTTLLAAVEAAGLVDTLKSEGPFTVFAPTEAAFAALPEGTIEALLADIPALTDILLYHVVAGSVLAADVVTLDSAPTVQGSGVTITVANGMVMIDDATVVVADIETSNGVIHVIDAVLLP